MAWSRENSRLAGTEEVEEARSRDLVIPFEEPGDDVRECNCCGCRPADGERPRAGDVGLESEIAVEYGSEIARPLCRLRPGRKGLASKLPVNSSNNTHFVLVG